MASWLDRTVYAVRARFPWLYDLMALGNAAATRVLYGRRIRRALGQATMTGTVFGQPAEIRPLKVADLNVLVSFIETMPDKHLEYFHPHRFDGRALKGVLKSRSLMTYGLFIDGDLTCYLILKLFATRRAYLGRLVAPSLAGQGIGKWLARYLYWQGYILRFRVCGTMNLQNLASKHSHESIRPFDIVAPLPTGYHLVEFHVLESDATPPELCIVRKQQGHSRPAAT